MSRLTRGLLALTLFMLGVVGGGAGVYLWTRPGPGPADPGPPRRWEATVFLPTRGNPDHPITERDWDDAVGLLAREFDGATLGPPQEGFWVNAAGKLLREPVRPVTVSFEPDRLDRFRQALRRLGRRLGQEALYVRYEEPRVEVLDAAP
jgi:hypothetical protein